MKPINTIIVSALCLTLGACSVSISEDGVNRHSRSNRDYDRLTVTLPNGDRDSFSCPSGTSSFVINRKDEGQGMVYGCRTDGTPMPTLGKDGGK